MSPANRPLRLSIELVPSTCWYSNVRSNVKASTWDRLQSTCFRKAGYRCEICDGVGPAHPVECHEIWRYDDSRRVQILVGLVALCPKCHEVKHMGRAMTLPSFPAVLQHFARVNGLSIAEAAASVKAAMEVFRNRSLHSWRLDVSFLSTHHAIKLDAGGREVGLAHLRSR